MRVLSKPKKPQFWAIFGLSEPSQPNLSFFQKPGSVTFLNLRCLTSCKKIMKKLMICCSCIADGLTEEHSQIYRTLVLGRVPNQFLYHVDVMDFELQYRCTLLKGFGWSYFFTRSDTSRNCSRQKSINLEQRQQRWQQSKIKIK